MELLQSCYSHRYIIAFLTICQFKDGVSHIVNAMTADDLAVQDSRMLIDHILLEYFSSLSPRECIFPLKDI